MKVTLVITALIMLIGCGGGSHSLPQNTSTPIDPSGNWTMVATDSNGNTMKLAALFSQTGSTVTANSFTAVGNAKFIAPCVPFSATFSNGTVTAGFGALAFQTTLNDAGTQATGTYSGLSAGNCAGIGVSGTFVADEVPTTSGSSHAERCDGQRDGHVLDQHGAVYRR